MNQNHETRGAILLNELGGIAPAQRWYTRSGQATRLASNSSPEEAATEFLWRAIEQGRMSEIQSRITCGVVGFDAADAVVIFSTARLAAAIGIPPHEFPAHWSNP